MARIVLGVGGGIAAYKACELLRLVTEAGHDLTVVPTPAATSFVGVATWAALSGKAVHTQVFEGADTVEHVRIGREAELVIVAPATADLIARAATGQADDLLTNVLLTARCPVLMAPAMHTEMWLHPATQANVATLRSRGVVVMDPAVGRLTGPDSGPGRLPDPADIAAVALTLLADPEVRIAAAGQDLAGRRVVVSAGGTREPLDPVRFLGNASSGRMGISLARAARLRGAEVTLVGAHLSEPSPASVDLVEVETTADLAAAMLRLQGEADIIIMAAAPADFTPAHPQELKLKKEGAQGLSLELVQTTDVLAALVSRRAPGQVIVGFAAETAASEAELIELGAAKLQRKGCDLLVLNNVSGGAVFGQAENTVKVLSLDGVQAAVSGDKNAVSHRILDCVPKTQVA